jgi:hypothetical protein
MGNYFTVHNSSVVVNFSISNFLAALELKKRISRFSGLWLCLKLICHGKDSSFSEYTRYFVSLNKNIEVDIR